MRYQAVFSKEVQRAPQKLKRSDRATFRRVEGATEKILAHPELGKPLRYDLKHHRREPIGSFVLVYELHGQETFFADYEHHDKVYRTRL